MNFDRLDSRELADVGIRFETEEETRAFAKMIRKELAVRIDKELSRHLTRKQLAEFGKCKSKDVAQRWLEKNYPDFPDIVRKQKDGLGNEIIKYRHMISGNIPDTDPDSG